MTSLNILHRPSPNFGDRPKHGQVSVLLLHYTDMVGCEEAVERLCDPTAKVSAHYVVDRDGAVMSLVAEDKRAWHAGHGAWADCENINDVSIGVEIVNKGHQSGPEPYPADQIRAVTVLCQAVLQRHPVPARNVLAHSDIAPSRKRDPGEWFPWKTLADAGVGLWVEPEPVTGGRYLARGDQGQPVEALQAMLTLYGYRLAITGTFDEDTQAVVTAFQRHFRPQRVDGIADRSTLATLHKLLRLIDPDTE